MWSEGNPLTKEHTALPQNVKRLTLHTQNVAWWFPRAGVGGNNQRTRISPRADENALKSMVGMLARSCEHTGHRRLMYFK